MASWLMEAWSNPDVLTLLTVILIPAVIARFIRGVFRSKTKPILSLFLVLTGCYSLWSGDDWWQTGFVVVTLFGVIVPTVTMGWTLRLAATGHFRTAANLSWIISKLEPRWRFFAQSWDALYRYYQGDTSRIDREIERMRTALVQEADTARQLLLAHQHDWPALRFSPIIELRIRALCELGLIDEAINESGRLWHGSMGFKTHARARNAMLPLFAFSGRVDMTSKMLEMARVNEAQHTVWIATALSARARSKTARETLELAEKRWIGQAFTRAQIAYRLDHLPAPAVVEEPGRLLLREASWEIDCAYHLRPQAPTSTSTFGALVLLVLIALGFCAQLLMGGIDDGRIAFKLGALVAEGRWPEESWRLITYGFLHFGWLHLATNVVVFSLFAPPVCRMLGNVNFILFYTLAVVTAGVNISYLGAYGVTIGASGGTMAMVGFLVSQIWSHHHLRSTRWGKLSGFILLALVIAQTAIDLFLPMVSSAGHLAGLMVGLVMGGLSRQKPSPSTLM